MADELTLDELVTIRTLLVMSVENRDIDSAMPRHKDAYRPIIGKLNRLIQDKPTPAPDYAHLLPRDKYAQHVYKEITTRYSRHQYDNVSAHQVNLAILGVLLDLLEK